MQGENIFFTKLFACYLAAIVHDYEHRGVNNDFLIKTSDPLALLYNDASPMKNHHVAAAFLLKRDPHYAFFPQASKKVSEGLSYPTSLPRPSVSQPFNVMQLISILRKDVIELVLATDMKQVRSPSPQGGCDRAGPGD